MISDRVLLSSDLVSNTVIVHCRSLGGGVMNDMLVYSVWDQS
jgi:hypothetical protein